MNLPIGFYLIGSFSTLAHETISWLPAIGFTARPLPAELNATSSLTRQSRSPH